MLSDRVFGSFKLSLHFIRSMYRVGRAQLSSSSSDSANFYDYVILHIQPYYIVGESGTAYSRERESASCELVEVREVVLCVFCLSLKVKREIIVEDEPAFERRVYDDACVGAIHRHDLLLSLRHGAALLV